MKRVRLNGEETEKEEEEEETAHQRRKREAHHQLNNGHYVEEKWATNTPVESVSVLRMSKRASTTTTTTTTPTTRTGSTGAVAVVGVVGAGELGVSVGLAEVNKTSEVSRNVRRNTIRQHTRTWCIARRGKFDFITMSLRYCILLKF